MPRQAVSQVPRQAHLQPFAGEAPCWPVSSSHQEVVDEGDDDGAEEVDGDDEHAALRLVVADPRADILAPPGRLHTCTEEHDEMPIGPAPLTVSCSCLSSASCYSCRSCAGTLVSHRAKKPSIEKPLTWPGPHHGHRPPVAAAGPVLSPVSTCSSWRVLSQALAATSASGVLAPSAAAAHMILRPPWGCRR